MNNAQQKDIEFHKDWTEQNSDLTAEMSNAISSSSVFNLNDALESFKKDVRKKHFSLPFNFEFQHDDVYYVCHLKVQGEGFVLSTQVNAATIPYSAENRDKRYKLFDLFDQEEQLTDTSITKNSQIQIALNTSFEMSENQTITAYKIVETVAVSIFEIADSLKSVQKMIED